MKAVAFANNDMAIVAWTFGGKLDAQRWARQMETDFDRARATPAGLRVTFDTLVDPSTDNIVIRTNETD